MEGFAFVGDFVAEAVGFPGEVEGAEISLIGAAELFAEVGAGETAEREEVVEHVVSLKDRAAPVAFVGGISELFDTAPAGVFVGGFLGRDMIRQLFGEAFLLELILNVRG